MHSSNLLFTMPVKTKARKRTAICPRCDGSNTAPLRNYGRPIAGRFECFDCQRWFDTIITASGKPRGARTETERRAQLAALEARAALKADALKLVEQLALYWIDRRDEPGSTKEAFELLIKHEYAFVATAPAKLLRPDGSEVTR